MENKNLFAIATAKKFRFESNRGVLSVEDLWDVPMTELDVIYRRLNKQLRDVQEESLLENTRRGITDLEMKVELVKSIFAAQQEQSEDAKNRAERRAKKQHLMNLLAEKQGEELKGLDAKRLQKMIAELED